MKLPLWQVDAFAARRFAGNPASVVALPHELPDSTLQAIAAENNQPETAFLLKRGSEYGLRWFTPTVEVPLCGHATLAAAWVVFERLEPGRRAVKFDSRSGVLGVTREGERLVLDFPAVKLEPTARDATLARALGAEPEALLAGGAWRVAVYGEEGVVAQLRPDLRAVEALNLFGVVVTAPGREVDFVSRFFAPSSGIPEDPVTGAAHVRLVPYWAQRLGKNEFHARQLSARGGELWCALRGDRVTMAGLAQPYLEGTIEV